jgi:ADP-ribose pyrophosphatase YjhB (NUDIX family)
VHPDESFAQAAKRESREEAGVQPKLDGILCIDREIFPNQEAAARIRVIFHSSLDHENTTIKSQPDAHSMRAAWFTREAIDTVNLRGGDILDFIDAAIASFK